MFALELDRRSREAGWGIVSNAAHPGLTKTNLQISGPSSGQQKPTMLARFYQFTWQFTPFVWQDVDEGILPALYAATSPQAEGGTFYGPSGLGEVKGKAAEASIPPSARGEPDNRRLWELSEPFTGVRYPPAD